ncbi:MAG: iron-sulfur cluster repair di-iron protein [Deltaproteobacteria bacterium]|nr:iron-sulfur cluster repair di-iron protein [Deltaproteobacteria bacterium]
MDTQRPHDATPTPAEVPVAVYTTADCTVADLAATRPKALRVLHRHGIDFCCGGRRTVAEACERAGVSADQLLAEVAELEASEPADERWDTAPLGELIDHIIDRHHRPLDDELPRLLQMAHRVVQVHGHKQPDRLPALFETVLALRDDLLPHMHKEEAILFPWMRSGRGADAQSPVRVMLYEHEAVGELLEKLRALTDGYTAPPGACATWRGLFQGLSELDEDLRLHIHLENNVLFPRALQAG